VLYSLYGVVEHSGTLRSGHYTCYVKLRSSQHTAVADCLQFIHTMFPAQMSVDHLVNKLCSVSHHASAALEDSVHHTGALEPSVHQAGAVEYSVCCDEAQQPHSSPSTHVQPQQESGHDRAEPVQPEEGLRWFHISDTSVTPVKLSTVLNCQAYILFYQRIA